MDRIGIGRRRRSSRPSGPSIRPSFSFRLGFLRRVIEQDCQLIGFALRVPHCKSYAIDAAALLEIVDRSELSPNDRSDLPSRVILLPRPTAEWPIGSTRAIGWRSIGGCSFTFAFTLPWRQASMARREPVRSSAEEHRLPIGIRWKAGVFPRPRRCAEPSSALALQRIQQIGAAAFEEIRLVLYQENFLLPPASDWSRYVEFAAVYLELRCSAQVSCRAVFPAWTIHSRSKPYSRRTWTRMPCFRPRGRRGPSTLRIGAKSITWPTVRRRRTRRSPLVRNAHGTPANEVPRADAAIAAAGLAGKHRSRGDLSRRRQCAPADMVDRVQDAPKMDLYRLVRRLQAALELDASDPQPWQDLLLVLARQTAEGFRTPESRLLYDLQKVCVDHEREIYTVDVVEWAISLGRRPVKRPLPHQRDVLMLRHSRLASRRLAVVRLTESQRERLAVLIRAATERVESRLREQLRPILTATLDEVGLRPRNTPEAVVRKKLIEELLDQIVDRGFFTMGILRDAISRNNLKLPDISGAGDFLHGDELLRRSPPGDRARWRVPCRRVVLARHAAPQLASVRNGRRSICNPVCHRALRRGLLDAGLFAPHGRNL